MNPLSQDVLLQIRSMAEEITQREGCMLYDLEFSGHNNQRVLRVFIDRADGNVSIDDCARISRGLNLLLDVRDIIDGGAYELEVSSPGLERHLKETWHYIKAIGQNVKLSAFEPLQWPKVEDKGEIRQGPTAVEGKLVSASEELVCLENLRGKWEVPRSLIRRAQVKFIFGNQDLKQRGKKLKKKKKR